LLKISLLCILSILSSVKGEDNECKFADKCYTEKAEDYVVKVSCDPNTPLQCTCEDGIGTKCSNDIDLSTPGVNYDNIDEVCIELCIQLNPDKDNPDTAECHYFKYEMQPAPDHIKVCFLMNKDQCQKAPSGDCEHDCHSEGMFCDGDHETPPHGTGKCHTTTEYHASEPKNNWLHWYCRNKDGAAVSFTDDSFDEETYCFTHHRCNDYDPMYENIRYVCTNVDGTTAEWQRFADQNTGTDYDGVFLTADSDRKLQEALCNAPELELNVESYGQEGLLITCAGDPIKMVCDTDNPPTNCKPKVPAENECLLLCDMYPILTFFPDWKKYGVDEEKEGERIWYYRYQSAAPDSEPTALVTKPDAQDSADNSVKNIIRCWN